MDAAAAIKRSFVERRKVEATADPHSLTDAELLEIIAEERAACQDRGSIDQSRRDQFHAGVITVGPGREFRAVKSINNLASKNKMQAKQLRL